MRLTAPGGAVERVLVELRQDAMARRRLGLYGLVGVLTLGGAFTLISFVIEWRGRNLAHDAAALERHADAPESAARIAAFGRRLGAEQPGFGGSLGYWEARAQILTLAARQRLAGDRQAAQTLFDQAEAAARHGLLVAPTSALAWQRLAEIEAARANWANDPAQALAKTVREVAPADPDAALWRVEFALTYWADLGTDMRQPALDDVAALVKLGGPWRQRVAALAAAAPAAAQTAVRARTPALLPPPPAETPVSP
jgi:hypothetical protein